MDVSWNITYRCEIYGENFNKYAYISSVIYDENIEMN